MGALIVRALINALSSPQVLAILERLISAAVGQSNRDQLALIRAELGGLERRVITELDALNNRLAAVEDRVRALEVGRELERRDDPHEPRPPGPPPHPPRSKGG